jgi:hypothetical protein
MDHASVPFRDSHAMYRARAPATRSRRQVHWRLGGTRPKNEPQAWAHRRLAVIETACIPMTRGRIVTHGRRCNMSCQASVATVSGARAGQSRVVALDIITASRAYARTAHAGPRPTINVREPSLTAVHDMRLRASESTLAHQTMPLPEARLVFERPVSSRWVARTYRPAFWRLWQLSVKPTGDSTYVSRACG